MPLSNTTLSAVGVQAAVLFFADFVDEPVRGAYAGMPLTVPSGLADADADCEGFTFDPVNSEVLQIGRVTHGDGGTDTLAFVLNADPTDPELLTAIENPSVYQGRKVRIWRALHDGAGTVTELSPMYRGYMTVPGQQSDGTNYTITMEAENYAGLLSAAQNRTYLNSQRYDAGDLSDAVAKGLPSGVPALPGGGGRAENFWGGREAER